MNRNGQTKNAEFPHKIRENDRLKPFPLACHGAERMGFGKTAQIAGVFCKNGQNGIFVGILVDK